MKKETDIMPPECLECRKKQCDSTCPFFSQSRLAQGQSKAVQETGDPDAAVDVDLGSLW